MEMNLTKREFLGGAAAALAGMAVRGGTPERYLLGCETLPYAAHPLPRALKGIRHAGYRYVMLFQIHAREPAFTPALSGTARAELRSRLQDSGLEPFMSFVGLSSDIRKPEGLKTYFDELDLNAE